MFAGQVAAQRSNASNGTVQIHGFARFLSSSALQVMHALRAPVPGCTAERRAAE
jgi:hypothetical protein